MTTLQSAAPMTRRLGVAWSGAALWAILGLLIVAPVLSFLILATSPRLLGQGTQLFTLRYISQALSGVTGQGVFNSLWVSLAVSVAAVCLATTLAWLVQRTNVYGRRLWPMLMWLLFLVPTWMMTLSWVDVLQPYGSAAAIGVPTSWLYGEFLGPFGIIVVLTIASLPFAYFVVSAGLLGVGSEYEDAARIHGAGRLATLRTVLPMVAPALLSAFAISYAETMSDFGVPFTLAYHSHFPMATYTLFASISSYPANFSVAAVIALVLILTTIPPIILQARVTRRRSYATVSGRARAVRRREFSTPARLATSIGIGLVFVIGLGVPLAGAVLGSFLRNLGIYASGPVHLSTVYYHQVFAPSIAGKGLSAPLMLSNQIALVAATATSALAFVFARRLMARSAGWSQRLTDILLVGSVAVPGVVLGVGYVFFYNLGFVTNHVISLYKTLPLLVLALVATSLPGQTRFLAGPVSQIQPSLNEAARVHGAARWRSWRTTTLPLVSRVMLWGWLLTFAKTIAELPISQILYPPSQEPLSVTIQAYLGNFQLGTGTAMTVVGLVEIFGVIVVALGL
ncbi:MAG TPA: iron ABC transporter permease, partial [Acidimicrobiales bacterium]|nr:iron ABC transporter permease [Acidimicrobiales bacterium]